ncbi:MAG: hypothetical protein OCD02_21890 [Spirochaetaceae bacterium]
MIGEVISVFIPNQRLDRVCIFLRELYLKIEDLEFIISEDYVKNIIEDAIHVVVNNRSTLKNKRLIELVNNAINRNLKPNLLENLLPVLSDEQVLIILFLYNRGTEESQ